MHFHLLNFGEDIAMNSIYLKTKYSRIGFISLSIVWLLFNLLFIKTYPAPTGDESHIASISSEYLSSGYLGAPLWSDFFGSSKHFLLWQSYNIALALFFRLVGIGLWQARFFSLMGAVVSGWLIFKLGQILYNETVGLSASALFLFSTRIFWMSHLARPETWVIAGGLIASLMFWQAQRTRKSWLVFTAGLLTTFIVDLYITNIHNSLTFLSAALITFGYRKEWKMLIIFAIGAGIGAVYWFLTRLAPDPMITLQQWSALYRSLSEQGTSFSLLDRLTIFPQYVRQGFLESSRLGLLESAYMLFGLIGLIIKRRKADLFILWWSAVLITGFFIFVYSGTHHIVDIMPALCLAIAASTFQLSEKLTVFLRRNISISTSWVASLLLLPLLTGYIGSSIYLGWQNRVIDYEAYASRLRELIPAGSNVLAEGTWWWFLRDGIYTADEYFVYEGVIPLNQPDAIYKVIQQRKVQVILVDENLTFTYLEHNRPDIYDALIEYANSSCRLAGTVEGYAYGVEQGGPAIKRTKVYLCPTPQ